MKYTLQQEGLGVNKMKISEVAKVVNLPISTIRYYEKIGIIPEDYIRREQNNYRDYAEEITSYLEVVKKSISMGFSLNDIKAMISKNGMSREEQTLFIKEKISEIEKAQSASLRRSMHFEEGPASHGK